MKTTTPGSNYQPCTAHRSGMQGSINLQSSFPTCAPRPRPSTRLTSFFPPTKPSISTTAYMRRQKRTTPPRPDAILPAATATPSSYPSPAPSSQPATNQTFFRTVIPTALALLVCNMDRICLSVAMVPIALELGWGEGVQGVVQSAFLWGYLANQLLGGALADKYGGKTVMAVGIAFFSFASALLPAVAITPFTAALGVTLPAVLLVRFLVGFGEGVALPSMNNLVATNVDKGKRATALGACFMGFQSGNLVGLLLSPLILQLYGWRSLFYVFGLLGIPLLLFWLAIVPPPFSSASSPSSSTEQQPPKQQQAVTYGDMLKNKPVWAIITANFINHWGYFIYLNWMPTFFYKVLGMDLRASSLMSFLPWLVMALGSSASGVLSDALVRWGVFTTTGVRKVVQSIAFLGPVVPLYFLSQVRNVNNLGTISTGASASGIGIGTGMVLTPEQAVLAMTMALGITSVGQFVTNMSDIAPRHAGRLFGLCNTFGSAAGILGVSVAGILVERTGSFGMVFQITALLNIVGAVVWNLLATGDKQFD